MKSQETFITDNGKKYHVGDILGVGATARAYQLLDDTGELSNKVLLLVYDDSDVMRKAIAQGIKKLGYVPDHVPDIVDIGNVSALNNPDDKFQGYIMPLYRRLLDIDPAYKKVSTTFKKSVCYHYSFDYLWEFWETLKKYFHEDIVYAAHWIYEQISTFLGEDTENRYMHDFHLGNVLIDQNYNLILADIYIER